MPIPRKTAIAVAALALAACSSSPAPATVTTGAATASPSASVKLVACSTLWQAGTVIPANLADTGCTDPHDGIVFEGSFNCRDGSILFGDSRFWGYAGKATHVAEAANDPAYSKAYDACNN